MGKPYQQLLQNAHCEYWAHTSDMAFVKDIHGIYRSASRPFAEMTGESDPAKLIGKTDFEIFSDAELAKRYTDDDKRLLAGGNAIENYVEPMTQKDGKPRYCLTSKYILKDEDGNAIGIMGIARDITVEYEARQVYENELKKLFELPPDSPIAVLFDVTEWRVVDARFRDETDHVASFYRRIDDYIENAAACVAEDEAVRSYFCGFSRAFLEGEYNRGIRSHAFEYLRLMANGAKRWVREELHFLLDPVNGHLSLIIILHDIDAKKRVYDGLLEAAERDAMTGLLNHDATVRHIEAYLAEASGMHALFMIDLDNFKQINDNFGHQYGDRILTDVGTAISTVFRSTDIVGRMGGDEFMALMKDVYSESVARNRAETLLTALQFNASNGDTTLELTTSVGVLLFDAAENDFQSLYNDADAALYQSKGEGKNRYTFFTGGARDRRRGDLAQQIESVSTVQLRTLLDYMDGGVVMSEVTDDIRITYVSPSLYRSFGRSTEGEEDSKQKIFSYVYPADLPGLRTALFKTAESDELLTNTYRVTTESGVEWRRIRAKRIPEQGDGIHRLVAVITDVSDLKHADEHLREAEVRYRTAVEQTNAMLWEVDIASKTLTLTGPAWDRLHSGTTVFPDAPGSYLATGAIHPDSVTRFTDMFQAMYAGDDSDTYFLLSRSNGGEVWVKNQFRLLRDENGRPYCALGITQLVPNINAEMHSFAHEMRFADIVQESLTGYVRVNFTKNQVEVAKVNGDAWYSGFSGAAYDDYIGIAAERCVDGEDALQFRQLTAREYLLASYLDGEVWKFIDYRRIGTDGQRRWTSLFIKLMRHPISGDVYAFCYLRDNNACRNWELSLNRPLVRNAALLLYSKESMELLAGHVISTGPNSNLVAMAVIAVLGLDRARAEMGEVEARDVLFTFGRLCRIAIGGDVIVGQLDESRVALLRADAGSIEMQRERVSSTMAILKELLKQAHPESNATLIGGFAVERADCTTYGQLLRKATVACSSAEQMLGESAVAYADTGAELAEEESDFGLEEKYHALELRYQQQANLLHLSENDELTGILGKRAFYRRVKEILDAGTRQRLAIVRFDINRFKVYNDVRGTVAGDKLLCDIAMRLRRNPGPSLALARLESDHFVLLTADDGEQIQRSKEKFERWLSSYSVDFRLSASIGVYRIDDVSVDVSLMCDRALLALRSVKSGFDTKLGYYNYTLRYRLIDEQQLINDMEQALVHEQFKLYFQPQVNYETGALIGAEALVRWDHPKRGLLPPGVFIPLFEKNGLVTRLDEYVWERCCRYVKRWLAQYPQARELSLSISVNVSRLDIYDVKLTEILKRLTTQYELPASALRLEITESAYMENPKQLIDTVHALQQAGFTVEMDDFGSGYSSLNTLKDVYVDVLKLDMKFLENCEDSARGGNILSSVIRMAHWLRIPIIVEGVETKAQADYLKSLGCVYMQGFLFAHPMPADAFEEMLQSGASSFLDRYRNANVEGMAAFWDPSAQMTLLFNSFVGGAAIMEYCNGVLEGSRVNDNFYRTLGTTREKYLAIQSNLLERFDEGNRERYLAEIRAAIATGEERDFELQGLFGVGGVTKTWMYNRIRLLAKNEDRAVLYVSIEDITDRKRMEQEREAETERRRLLMETTGAGFFDYDYASDTLRYQVYIPGTGVKEHTVPNCSESSFPGERLHPDSVEALRQVIRGAKDGHVDGEIEFVANLTGTGMRWWRIRYASVEDADGRVYRMVAQGDDIQDIKDRASISEAIRQRLNVSSHAYTFNDDVVDQIFGLFYASSDIDGAIKTTLSLLGEYYDLSRAYIFEDTAVHDAMVNTFEWCAPGVAAQIDNLQNVRYADIGGREVYINWFDKSGVWHCPDVAALPRCSREILEPQGIRSMLQYAIRDNGVFSGMIGFDECRENRNWTDEQTGTLMFVSRIIAAYLLRHRQSNSADFSADFRAALDDNAEYIYIIEPDTYKIVYTNKNVYRHTGADCIGKICYREFIGRSEPCVECPVRSLYDATAPRLVEAVRSDGMVVLSQASPLRWSGRDMVMISSFDITEDKQDRRGG